MAELDLEGILLAGQNNAVISVYVATKLLLCYKRRPFKTILSSVNDY